MLWICRIFHSKNTYSLLHYQPIATICKDHVKFFFLLIYSAYYILKQPHLTYWKHHFSLIIRVVYDGKAKNLARKSALFSWNLLPSFSKTQDKFRVILGPIFLICCFTTCSTKFYSQLLHHTYFPSEIISWQ